MAELFRGGQSVYEQLRSLLGELMPHIASGQYEKSVRSIDTLLLVSNDEFDVVRSGRTVPASSKSELNRVWEVARKLRDNRNANLLTR